MRAHIYVVAAFLVLFAARAAAQEHAPTLDQCRADRDLWMYQIPKGSTAHKDLRERLASMDSHALCVRQVEMTKLPDGDRPDS